MGGEVKSKLERLQKEAERRRRLLSLRSDTLRKIQFIRQKTVLDGYDVYRLVMEFFRNYLDQQHQFTIKELRRELRSTYISSQTRGLIGLVLEKLHRIEYHELNASHDELLQILDTFRDIVRQLIRIGTARYGILSRLQALLFHRNETPETIIAELPVRESNEEENVRIHLLIERCYAALDGHKLRKAKAAYAALLAEYGRLAPDERRRFYPLLEQTYRDIQQRAKEL